MPARRPLRQTFLAGVLFLFMGLTAGVATFVWSSAPAGDPPPEAAVAQRMRVIQAEHSPLDWRQRAVSLFGLAALLGLCWAVSNNRRRVDWRLVAWGVGLQLLFAVLVLKTGPGLWVFARLNDGVNALLGFTREGTVFLFRSFVTGKMESPLVNFTFEVLPTIIFFSSLMTVLYHLGVMQWVVRGFAVAMQKTMRTSGAETLSTSANIFVGQTEAPLVVKPYIEKMTLSELMAVMVGGFANTAGGVLAAYVGMLRDVFPDIAGHLIAQSVMSAPAALVCAKLAFPETDKPETAGRLDAKVERVDANVIDAASRGATEGLRLAFNVAAMLLAFIALIALANAALRTAGGWVGFPGLSLERVFGWAGWPLAWIMGVPAQDCFTVGKLIGIKTVVNEFVAYLNLADMLKAGEPLSYRAVVIASYALSGFANFSSIAIQIGGISAIAPCRRHDLARLGLRAMFIGAVATFTTATIAGLLI
jgi:concentrative nucleoside transporter, CNT family